MKGLMITWQGKKTTQNNKTTLSGHKTIACRSTTSNQRTPEALCLLSHSTQDSGNTHFLTTRLYSDKHKQIKALKNLQFHLTTLINTSLRRHSKACPLMENWFRNLQVKRYSQLISEIQYLVAKIRKKITVVLFLFLGHKKCILEVLKEKKEEEGQAFFE